MNVAGPTRRERARRSQSTRAAAVRGSAAGGIFCVEGGVMASPSTRDGLRLVDLADGPRASVIREKTDFKTGERLERLRAVLRFGAAMRLPLVLCLSLAACGTTYAVPVAGPDAGTAGGQATAPTAPPGRARTPADFARVVARVEPAAERMCRQERPDVPADLCDYRITLIRDPKAAPNAYQSMGEDGRPDIHLAASLLPMMQSDDEIAFVLSHEAGHYIAGHLSKQGQQQALGAVIGGLAAAMGNAYGLPMSQDEAMNMGASLGGRAYSQTYELEADTLGAFIAARAGYDPERGGAFFQRPEIASAGGLPIFASHPASAQREATVAAAAAEIRRQRASGREPTPDAAG